MAKIVFFLLLFYQSQAQTVFSGSVKNTDSSAVAGAAVHLRDSLDQTLLYVFTDKNGNFNFENPPKNANHLWVKAMGFEAQKVKLGLKTNIILYEEAQELEDIVINYTRPVVEKGDTVVYDASAFLKGNESVVEDLLKKLPGIHVTEDGAIMHGNKEVEKVMIEGDDFFEKGYRLVTKNMPVRPIYKVELLRNFSNNKHLKGIENSDKVALNLKLKDGYKGEWFGNITAGFAPSKHYESKLNLMNFSKKVKYYILGNLNSVGSNVTGDLGQLIYSNSEGIGNSESAQNILGLGFSSPPLGLKRININRDKLVSFNSIFTIAENTKIKPILFFQDDNKYFYRNSFQRFQFENTSFLNTENFSGKRHARIGFAKVDLIHDFSKNQTLDYTIRYVQNQEKQNSSILFNDIPLAQVLRQNSYRLDQKAVLTHKVNGLSAMVFSARHIDEKRPQTLFSNQFLLGDYLGVDANSSQQDASNRMVFLGTDAKWYSNQNGLWEIKIGASSRKDFIASKLGLDNKFEFYDSKMTYSTASLFLEPSYQIKWNKVRIIPAFSVSQLFNTIKEENETRTQNPFLINPKLGLRWNVFHKQNLAVNYGFNTQNANALDVYGTPVQVNYRSIKIGTNRFEQLDASSFLAAYNYGDFHDSFFFRFNYSYIKNHDYFTSNQLIHKNYSVLEKVKVHNQEIQAVNGQVSQFLKPLASNFKLEMSFSSLNFENVVNNSDWRKINNFSSQYGLELRSGFKGFFNYHIGSKWVKSKVKSDFESSFTTNRSFLDLNFDMNEKLNFVIQNEYYAFGNNSQKAYFIDLEGKFTLKPNKLTLILSCNNILNTQTFSQYSISDINNSETNFTLLPRILMLKLEFRF